MRNFLMATTAFALAGGLAAAPAAAADMLSVGVGGYMQQWFGMSSVDDTTKAVKDGTAQNSDSEIHFKGKLESDNGLTFSIKVELEGNSHNTGKNNKATSDGKHTHNTAGIDESQLTVSGEFGAITLGNEDPASTLTHHGGLDVGISLNCGDVHHWINGLDGCSHNGFGTYGHGHGDKNLITYFSPRVSGVQFGVSYIPNATQEHRVKAMDENDNDAWAVGGNYVGDFGGANVAFSLGHYSRQKADDKGFMTMTGATADDDLVTDAGFGLTDGMADETTVDTMMKGDDKTFSNAALQVGFGAFSFGVVYATNDGGNYTTETYAMLTDPTSATATKPAMVTDESRFKAQVGEEGDDDYMPAGDLSASAGDYHVRQKFVKNTANDWDTWGAGVKYTEGPMAVSLSHLATERDNGDEQDATMLSMSYTLAPGVASKTSIFSAEKSFANGRTIDGTAFVTGFALSF